MGRTVKRKGTPKTMPPPNPVVELLDLISPRVTEDGEDPNVYTRKELEAVWKMKDKKAMAAIHQLVEMGKATPVMAKRQGLHGPLMVKAYRLSV